MRLKEDAAKKAQDARELEEEVRLLLPRPCISCSGDGYCELF